GGAIYTDFSNSSVTVETSTLRDHEAVDGDGGGIYSKNVVLTVSDSTLQDNSASSGRGGIRLFATNYSNLVGNSFIGNSGMASGGALDVTDSTNVLLVNDTLTENS